MMNETGNFPGQAWLWLYTLWYQVPPMNTSSNGDVEVWAIMMVLTRAAGPAAVHPRIEVHTALAGRLSPHLARSLPLARSRHRFRRCLPVVSRLAVKVEGDQTEGSDGFTCVLGRRSRDRPKRLAEHARSRRRHRGRRRGRNGRRGDDARRRARSRRGGARRPAPRWRRNRGLP